MTDLFAEIGLAHDGSLWLAHGYIEAVAGAATGVKFQAHCPEESSEDETWRTPPPTGESRAAYWARTSFTREQWTALATHARDKGLLFGLSFFHDSLVEPLAPLCDFLKVPAGAVSCAAIMEAVQRAQKPTFVSDGLHPTPPGWTRLICCSRYPTPMAMCGLTEIRPGVDGLSDHTGEPLTAALAAYAGAVAVEAHVTFDTRTTLADATASLTVNGLAQARYWMDLATEARHGLRPPPSAESQRRYGYTLRGDRWCKPAADSPV